MAKLNRTDLEALAASTNIKDQTNEEITPLTVQDQLLNERESVLNYLSDFLSATTGYLLQVNPTKDGLTFVDPDSINIFDTEINESISNAWLNKSSAIVGVSNNAINNDKGGIGFLRTDSFVGIVSLNTNGGTVVSKTVLQYDDDEDKWYFYSKDIETLGFVKSAELRASNINNSSGDGAPNFPNGYISKATSYQSVKNSGVDTPLVIPQKVSANDTEQQAIKWEAPNDVNWAGIIGVRGSASTRTGLRVYVNDASSQKLAIDIPDTGVSNFPNGLTSNGLNVGVSANLYGRNVDDSSGVYSGGTDSGGGNMIAYGKDHATNPAGFSLRRGGTIVMDALQSNMPSFPNGLSNQGKTNFEAELTGIVSGAITYTSTFMQLTGEGSSEDDLTDINGGVKGDYVILRNGASSFTVKNTGNIRLSGGADAPIGNFDIITLINTNGTVWAEVSRSINS